MQTYKLNTGLSIPAIGFGTWEISPDEAAREAVANALAAGYRIIDTAKIYGNEQGVGQAIRESGVPRHEIIVTTKVWNDDQGYDRTMKAYEKSLERLGLDYLDLYLIHWPASSKRHDSWRAMEQLYKDQRIKAAGICNYTVRHLQDLLERSAFVPAINQVEFHPYVYEQQLALLSFCAQHDILIEAYSPLNRISRRSHSIVDQIAVNHGKSPQQVILRWCVQLGTLPLPRSVTPDHIIANLDIFDFTLAKAELEQLNSMSDGERVTWDPAGMG